MLEDNMICFRGSYMLYGREGVIKIYYVEEEGRDYEC